MTHPLATIEERLEAVAAEAATRSAEIEAARSIPGDLVERLVDSGVLRLSLPEDHGGVRAGLSSVVGAVGRVAFHDASLAWVVLSGLVAGLDAARLPAHHANEIHGGGRTLAGGDRSPTGQARIGDDGSLVVSGRWGWGTAAGHCTWIGGGVKMVDQDGEPVSLADGSSELFVYLRRDQVVVLDTWHAVGLRGAGATDYVATDAVVPEGRWVSQRIPLGADRPLHLLDPSEVLAVGAAAVAVGVAGRAVRELAAIGASPVDGRGTRVVQGPPARLALAGASATVRSVGADLRALADRLDRADLDGPIDAALAADLSSAAVDGVRRSADAVLDCYRAAGPLAAQHASPLQRLVRDVEVVAQHPSVSPSILDRLGLWLFGGAT